jgi:hypothetical protein
MTKVRLLFGVALGLSLVLGLGVSAEEGGGITSVYSVVACRDSATVVVDVYSPYATNLVRARVSYLDENGAYQYLAQERSSAFGAGHSRVMVTVLYAGRQVDAHTSLMLDVQLKRSYGSSWADVGLPVIYYTSAADRQCAGLCSVVVETSDRAPADGTITLRSRYGSWFRPEGALLGAMSVMRGTRATLTYAGLPCDWTVRAWYYPKTGDTTPQMLPSQYWPGEYQVTALGGTNPYVTSFAAGLPATAPLEEDDPYAVD